MHRWKLSALAAAALVSVSLTATDAWALALGQLQVQSALGEPLRAEVALPQITASEADSLKASIATPAVFLAQGMAYSATASRLSVQLQRRPDGSAVLRLSSAQPINDPFVDLVIDASWNAGHVVRSYTLLLDPPALRKAAPAETAAPQVTEPAVAATRPAPAALPATRPASTVAAPTAAAPTLVARARAPQPQNAPPSLTVRPGDTASRLVTAHRPAGVSLDQMLVAMLRANPHAFISGNVNRIKAGAVVEMPDQAAALATPMGEARQIVAAQSRDFNEYRRRLAGAAPLAAVAAANRRASGNVQAQVDDKKPSTAAPDKLTLSKGALQANKADERLAQEKQAQSQSERLAELSRNLNELEQVAGAAVVAAAPAAGGIALPADGNPLTTSAPPETAAPANNPAPTPTPAGPAVNAAPAAAPAPQAAPSFANTLLEQPALPLAGAGLLALLLGYAGYRVVQRRRQQAASSENQLSTDSFFGADGGRDVDTAQSQFGNGASMNFSHSQLDTGGEVDPVAEAEVYLAYGRDLQAEEILREALHSQPERIAVHQKLADIYARRQDRKAFEVVGETVFALTQGQGAEWLHLAEQGRALEPDNPLYQTQTTAEQPADQAGTDSAPPTTAAVAVSPMTLAAGGFAAALADAAQSPAAPEQPEQPEQPEPSFSPEGLKFDLDLDLNLGSGQGAPAAPEATRPAEEPEQQAQQVPAATSNSIDFEPLEPTWKLPASAAPAPSDTAPADFGLSPLPENVPDSTTDRALDGVSDAASDTPDDLPTAKLVDHGLGWSLESNDMAPQPAPEEPATPLALPPEVAAPEPDAPSQASASATSAAPTFDFPEFDLGGLTLDLGDAAPATSLSESSQAAAEDPLATKLALAQEFAAIGDSEGARTLIAEVVEEADGELKERARRLLTEIE